jgi:hypothetical protein
MILGLRATAKELGISHVALLKAVKDGRAPRRADGNFDVEKCRAALAQNTQPKRSQQARRQKKAVNEPVTSSGPVKAEGEESAAPPVTRAEEDAPAPNSIAEAARQLEWEKFRRARLKNDQDEGRLADVAAVNAFVAGMIIKARDEMMRIGPEIRDDLARQTDPIECERIVTKRVTQALEHLAEYTGA